MKNISKDKVSIYLFNAYSNLDPQVKFISGSDRVGISLLNFETKKVIVIAPQIFKSLVSDKHVFYSSDNFKTKNLFLRYLLRVFITLFILKKLKKQYVISKIVSTSDFFPDVIPSFIMSFNTRWYAFTYHLYPLRFNLRDTIGRFLQLTSYILFLNSFKIVTCSSECKNFLKKNFRLNKILKITLGIDINKYASNFPKNSELIFLGRIKNSKGVFDLPHIISLVKKDYPKIKLKIIGNGSHEDRLKLENLIETYNVSENIIVLNNLSDEDVILQLRDSSILIQPSYEEGFGLSVLEALASGMRVVLYNLPVYKEHFNGFDLSYVNLGDREEFARQIIKTLSKRERIEYLKEKFNIFSWKSIFLNIFYF
jgi:glycosyltransferase involved in cell wall biosynthesis